MSTGRFGTLRGRIELLLQDLEHLATVEAIANFFESLGYDGVVCCCERCVVAQYLWAELRPDELHMTETLVEARIDNERASVPVPPIIGEFIQRFDKLEFPAIVRDEGDRQAECLAGDGSAIGDKIPY